MFTQLVWKENNRKTVDDQQHQQFNTNSRKGASSSSSVLSATKYVRVECGDHCMDGCAILENYAKKLSDRYMREVRICVCGWIFCFDCCDFIGRRYCRH